MSLGTWTTPAKTQCDNNFLDQTNCYSTTIVCPYATGISATYGYAIPTSGPIYGTIVYFTGGGGKSNGMGDLTYVQYYYKMGYAIVQLNRAS